MTRTDGTDLGDTDTYSALAKFVWTPASWLRGTLSLDYTSSDENGTPLQPWLVGIPPGVPASVRHIITFRRTGSNLTEMTVTEYGYTLEEARNLSKMGMEQCIDKMMAAVAKTA